MDAERRKEILQRADSKQLAGLMTVIRELFAEIYRLEAEIASAKNLETRLRENIETYLVKMSKLEDENESLKRRQR